MSTTATLYPTADVSNTGSWSTGPLWSLIDDVDDSNYNESSGADAVSTFLCTMQDMPAALAIASVTLYARQNRVLGAYVDETSRLWLKSGGSNYYSGYSNLEQTPTQVTSYTWTTDPFTGVPWTVAGVNAIQAGWDFTKTPGIGLEARCYSLYLVVTYEPVPASIAVGKHIASVELWLKRRPEMIATFKGNLDVLNAPILTAIDLEHTAGFHPTDAGWEDEVWQRRPFAVHGYTIDCDALSVTAEIKDQRPIQCLLRDLAWSSKPSGALGDGIARFANTGEGAAGTAAPFTFERTGEHSFTNAVSATEIVAANVPAYGTFGLYILPASGARGAARYYCANNTAARVFNAAQGSFQCEVKLEAVSTVANQTVFYVYHDASNWAWLYWDPVTATDRWVFGVRAAGTTYRAIKETTPGAATTIQAGCRWTGVEAENGATAYTLSIFIDRVKGTDAVGALMTEAASSNMDFGTKGGSGTDILNGQIRKIHSYQYCLTDTEMMRAI